MPTLNKCGGIESFYMNYYKNLSGLFEVDFITHECNSDEYEELIKSKNGKLFLMPKLNIITISLFVNKIKAFFNEHHHYDIVHCNMANAAYFYFREAKKHNINIRILHSHQCKFADKPLHAIRNIFLISLGKKYATHYLACGKEAGQFMFKKGFTVISNAINISKFSYDIKSRKHIRKTLGINGSEILLGNIGRLVPQKNQLFLLNLLKKLDLKKYKVAIIGEGELRSRLIKAAKDKGVQDNIIFVSPTSDVAKYYSAFDAFLLPSSYEGLPVVGVEAQASGLPCYFADTITKELRISEHTYFLDIKDVNAWCNKIRNIPAVERKNNEIINQSKYNILNSVKLLEDYYLKSMDETQR